MSARTYNPWREKHKAPQGFGSHCPAAMTDDEAQELLDEAVELPDESGNALWVVRGDWCFVARPTRLEENIWHGYPKVGSEISDRVLKHLHQMEKISRRQKRRFRKQKQLPKSWP